MKVKPKFSFDHSGTAIRCVLGILSLVAITACSPIVHDAMPVAFGANFIVQREWVKKKRREQGTESVRLEILRDIDQDETIAHIAIVPLYGTHQQILDHGRTITIHLNPEEMKEPMVTKMVDAFYLHPSFQGENLSGLRIYLSPEYLTTKPEMLEFKLEELKEYKLEISIRSPHYSDEKERKYLFGRWRKHLYVD